MRTASGERRVCGTPPRYAFESGRSGAGTCSGQVRTSTDRDVLVVRTSLHRPLARMGPPGMACVSRKCSQDRPSRLTRDGAVATPPWGRETPDQRETQGGQALQPTRPDILGGGGGRHVQHPCAARPYQCGSAAPRAARTYWYPVQHGCSAPVDSVPTSVRATIEVRRHVVRTYAATRPADVEYRHAETTMADGLSRSARRDPRAPRSG